MEQPTFNATRYVENFAELFTKEVLQQAMEYESINRRAAFGELTPTQLGRLTWTHLECTKLRGTCASMGGAVSSLIYLARLNLLYEISRDLAAVYCAWYTKERCVAADEEMRQLAQHNYTLVRDKALRRMAQRLAERFLESQWATGAAAQRHHCFSDGNEEALTVECFTGPGSFSATSVSLHRLSQPHQAEEYQVTITDTVDPNEPGHFRMDMQEFHDEEAAFEAFAAALVQIFRSPSSANSILCNL